MHWFNSGQWPCYIGFTTNRTAWRNECKRLGLGRLPFVVGHGNAMCRTIEGNRGGLMVVITAVKPSKRVSWEAYAAMIAHEAVHAMQFIKERYSANEPLGVETEAYLVQYITQECLQVAYNTGRSIATCP